MGLCLKVESACTKSNFFIVIFTNKETHLLTGNVPKRKIYLFTRDKGIIITELKYFSHVVANMHVSNHIDWINYSISWEKGSPY